MEHSLLISGDDAGVVKLWDCRWVPALLLADLAMPGRADPVLWGVMQAKGPDGDT